MTAENARGPARASIFILPLARRVGRIREVVSKYDRLKGQRARSYQERVIEAERSALMRLGLHADAIDRELHAFNEAVRSERTLRRYGQFADVAQDVESGGSAA